jgi:hypothetical protein
LIEHDEKLPRLARRTKGLLMPRDFTAREEEILEELIHAEDSGAPSGDDLEEDHPLIRDGFVSIHAANNRRLTPAGREWFLHPSRGA